MNPATEIFRRPDSLGGGLYQPWDGQRINGYRHVDGVILGTTSPDQLLTSWLEIVTDAVNQAGATSCLDADQLATTWQPGTT